MMASAKMVAMVLAGGEGTRLRPLTSNQAKPALSLVNGYRLIDFVFSNLVNSGIGDIYVLAQYKAGSLIAHIDSVWASHPRASIRVLLPQSDGGFKGTADAVRQNLHVIERHRPDLVGIFAADHVYRMDVRQMASYHRGRNATITVAAVPVPLGQAGAFGIMAANADGAVKAFEEKPARPAAMPANPDLAYASMGNYLFDPVTLQALLLQAEREGGSDFGHHILPRTLGHRRVYAYNLAENSIPGLREYEEPAYWRDVGTLKALAETRHDVSRPYPRLHLDNPHWPIHGENATSDRIDAGNAEGRRSAANMAWA